MSAHRSRHGGTTSEWALLFAVPVLNAHVCRSRALLRPGPPRADLNAGDLLAVLSYDTPTARADHERENLESKERESRGEQRKNEQRE